MEILYAYSSCSNNKYSELFLGSQVMILQQAQKYHSLLTEGLRDNGVEIVCTSGLPVNRYLTKKLFFKREKETIDGIAYHYFGFVNLPLLRQAGILFGSFFRTLSFCRDKGKKTVICDILNISNAAAALIAAKSAGVKVVGIVTDLPDYLISVSEQKKSIHLLFSRLKTKINQLILRRFDAYVFLTEQMNSLVNKRHCPYVVLEGHVDINMAQRTNRIEDKAAEEVVLYAGSLMKKYGIEALTRAFIDAAPANCVLLIYGDGDFKQELMEVCKAHPQVRYMGVKPNDYIINEEIKATLLINPRPTIEEYTKYSFPSKNMEYMASGTPVLTTKLPGMPEEYAEYVYIIEDETVEGLAGKLKHVMSKSREELHEKGAEAKKFVLREKNNDCQAAKIIKLIMDLN